MLGCLLTPTSRVMGCYSLAGMGRSEFPGSIPGSHHQAVLAAQDCKLVLVLGLCAKIGHYREVWFWLRSLCEAWRLRCGEQWWSTLTSWKSHTWSDKAGCLELGVAETFLFCRDCLGDEHFPTSWPVSHGFTSPQTLPSFYVKQSSGQQKAPLLSALNFRKMSSNQQEAVCDLIWQ